MFVAKNKKSRSEKKCIDIKYLTLREHVRQQKLVIEHINTKLMIADPLTKGLPPKLYKEHVEHIDLILLQRFYVIEIVCFTYHFF